MKICKIMKFEWVIATESRGKLPTYWKVLNISIHSGQMETTLVKENYFTNKDNYFSKLQRKLNLMIGDIMGHLMELILHFL